MVRRGMEAIQERTECLKGYIISKERSRKAKVCTRITESVKSKKKRN